MAQFLTNKNHNFLKYLRQELETCETFLFSVSFIKNAGLELIEKYLVAALERGVQGKIITSTYQNFTDLVTLEKFLSWQLKYDHFACHVDVAPLGDRGFHSKGYLFKRAQEVTTLIGSSNITSFALLRNIEWNARIVKEENERFVHDILNDFDALWNNSLTLTRKLIDDYERELEYSFDQWDMDYFALFNQIEPNYMQKKALKELARNRGLGVKKALVVSATGSGKTYLSAFDARNFGAEKLLFVVHRDIILKDALETFKKVFGHTRTYGFYTGTSKDEDKDFLFATNIMLSSKLDKFDPQAFDYIILDECHHVTSSTYQKIMSHFHPKFYLGLTATPERMDNQDVFELFDKNVPYELRLREALENDLIVPFKYFGIRDHLIDYGRDNKELLRQMTTVEHCEFIIENIEKHRTDKKLKALVFCRSVEHAEQMAAGFNSLGYNATYLVGRNDISERKLTFSNLQNDDQPLEILFSVDLLNEGVDLPAVNMVVFLRPTESSTIFIQQLGRGLRKFPGKTHLVVLDFIGNSYERSVQIAMALGTLSKSSVVEKQLLIDYVKDDFRSLNLPIEIHLDPYSKNEILNYIEKTNYNRNEFLKQDYLNFKKIIGSTRYVRHTDYINNEYAPDLMRFIKTNLGKDKYGYFSFLQQIEKDMPDFSEEELTVISKLSAFLPLVRPYEFAIIKRLIDFHKMTINELREDLSTHWPLDEDHFKHALANLNNELLSDNERQSMSPLIIRINDEISLNFEIKTQSFSQYLLDIIDYGLGRYLSEFGNSEIGLSLFHNYTTAQFMMMTLQGATRYFKGTKFEENHTTYILAGLKKDLDEDHHLNYKDKFIDDQTFQWESETNATLHNKTGKKILGTKVAHLFIRKKISEDGLTLPYIYIGRGHFTNIRVSQNPKSTLLVDIVLEEKIPPYLHYDFQIKHVY